MGSWGESYYIPPSHPTQKTLPHPIWHHLQTIFSGAQRSCTQSFCSCSESSWVGTISSLLSHITSFGGGYPCPQDTPSPAVGGHQEGLKVPTWLLHRGAMNPTCCNLCTCVQRAFRVRLACPSSAKSFFKLGHPQASQENSWFDVKSFLYVQFHQPTFTKFVILCWSSSCKYICKYFVGHQAGSYYFHLMLFYLCIWKNVIYGENHSWRNQLLVLFPNMQIFCGTNLTHYTGHQSLSCYFCLFAMSVTWFSGWGCCTPIGSVWGYCFFFWKKFYFPVGQLHLGQITFGPLPHIQKSTIKITLREFPLMPKSVVLHRHMMVQVECYSHWTSPENGVQREYDMETDTQTNTCISDARCTGICQQTKIPVPPWK